MATFLFDKFIFGPVKSRRLGASLGINLLPLESKYCNFNCIYCECGFTPKVHTQVKTKLPARVEIHDLLAKELAEMRSSLKIIDTITFAGNGEPTLHPEFAEIVDDTIMLRDQLFPEAKIAVLSNATRIVQPFIHNALSKVDYNILKLDSVNEETIRLINCPSGNFNLSVILENLGNFKNLTVQSMFFRGIYKNKPVDNSTGPDVDALVETISGLNPEHVMLYTISRDTPVDNLRKIKSVELEEIAEKFRNKGLDVSVSS